MDFLTLLQQEHNEAKEMFQKLLDQEEIDREEAETLCQKLLLHMEMEEKFFYPRMEEFKQTEELAEEAELEHTEAKRHLRAIINKDLDDVELKVKLEVLQLEITHHADEEESEVFPQARKLLSRDDVQEITEKMMALKEKKQATIAK